MTVFSVAICTYNRANWLAELVAALRAQECRLPFEILIVDNNSTDGTAQLVQQLQSLPGAPVRYRREGRQGIVFARNLALESCSQSAFMAFIDDDELPEPGWLQSACYGLDRDGADCVGGRIQLRFSPEKRPAWLEDPVLCFLGYLDYGEAAFWITDDSKPIWSGNVAYRMSLFNNSRLRFDVRYNRAGKCAGGGEDLRMFRALGTQGAKLRYIPGMVISHRIEPWKLKRRYFLKLHMKAGRQAGLYETAEFRRSLAGVPPFIVMQALKHWKTAGSMILRRRNGSLLQSMIAAYASGRILGRIQGWKLNRADSTARADLASVETESNISS
jgi:glycosyltransferase involved in cell wall biosynthesis